MSSLALTSFLLNKIVDLRTSVQFVPLDAGCVLGPTRSVLTAAVETSEYLLPCRLVAQSPWRGLISHRTRTDPIQGQAGKQHLNTGFSASRINRLGKTAYATKTQVSEVGQGTGKQAQTPVPCASPSPRRGHLDTADDWEPLFAASPGLLCAYLLLILQYSTFHLGGDRA